MKSVKVKVVNPLMGSRFPLPEYKTPGSAGMDLCACIEEPLTIHSNETVLIPTGLSIFLEDTNLAGLLLPRSGLGHKHGIVLGNLVGLIDSDYQGELQISCWNRGDYAFIVNPGDRIAQFVVVPVVQCAFELVETFEATERAEGGFGHSGVTTTNVPAVDKRGWTTDKDLLHQAHLGRICPKCLKSTVLCVGAAPDLMHMNYQYDCTSCGTEWEGA